MEQQQHHQQRVPTSPLHRSLLDVVDDDEQESNEEDHQVSERVQQIGMAGEHGVATDDDEHCDDDDDDDDDSSSCCDNQHQHDAAPSAYSEHDATRALAASVMRQVSAVEASKSRVHKAKLSLARGQQQARHEKASHADAASNTKATIQQSAVLPVDQESPLLVLHETLADDLSSSDDDDGASNQVTSLKEQVKLLRQSLHSVHESLIDVEENAALKHAKLELQLEYSKKALADSKAYNAHLMRRNQSLQSFILNNNAAVNDQASVAVSNVETGANQQHDDNSNLSDTTLNSNLSSPSINSSHSSSHVHNITNQSTTMSRQERLLKREMHTERHLMTLLQERKQLSDANFELQKRVLYWQHLTKQCDGCRERMARWKERRVQEKLQQQESETGLVTSASMDLEQVNEELTEVNGDEEDDVKPILNVSPITPPTTNKTVKPGMLRTSVQPASTGAEAAVRKPLMLSSPPPFSKTKPALRNSPSHTLATMSNAKESLEATGALAPPRLAAASPPSLNNKRTSASPPRPQPRTLTPPDKPLRGILKTNSSNSGATGDSKSQLSLMRNQNSIYITDLQNSTRNVLNTSSSNSSHIAPAPAAVLSSTSSMFSNSDESLSASRLDVSSVPQPQQHLKVLELGTLAELSSARSQLRQDNGEMSSAFHESQKTLDSTLPSDGSLVSLQDSSRLVLLDSSKLTASMTTTNTNSNSSGQLPFENYASSQGGGSAMHTHLPALSVSSASESASQLSRVSTTLRPGECHSKPVMIEAPATPVPKRPLKTSLKHRLSWPKKLLHRSNSADSGNGKDRSENSNETATYRSTAMSTLRDRDQGKFGHS